MKSTKYNCLAASCFFTDNNFSLRLNKLKQVSNFTNLQPKKIYQELEIFLFELMRIREIATCVALGLGVIGRSVSDHSQIRINSIKISNYFPAVSGSSTNLSNS